MSGGLPWKFEPEQTEINVRIGEVVTAFYTVTNLRRGRRSGRRPTTSTPLTAGIHFQKIKCFCFTEQRMAAGETREMPVVFYVDPALATDAEHDQLGTITLSYTFFRCARSPSRSRRRLQTSAAESCNMTAMTRRAAAPTETAIWPTRTPSITTTTSSIRARGRSSARSRRSSWRSARSSGCTIMYTGAPLVFGVGVIGVLYTMVAWWRDVIREANTRRPHPRGAAASPLRHDPVHRLRGDVLRRLVLGLLRRRAVSGRRASGRARHAVRRRLAAEGHRDLRSRGTCRCSTR